eukprot:5800004-Prymnesium_polylepis.2
MHHRRRACAHAEQCRAQDVGGARRMTRSSAPVPRVSNRYPSYCVAVTAIREVGVAAGDARAAQQRCGSGPQVRSGVIFSR